ncbi:thioesterase domain-containing protein [Streptomyces sp. HSG2]|uniref:thioesterase domain-containing protein n=1 Tax=Streptomyces sp. HSG2 TaxID=2797167 RepID=UPI0019031659
MNSEWFRRFTTSAGNGPRLVCFPHAGGSATAYTQLARALPADFDVVAVQYPGRQDRYDEAPFTCLDRLVASLSRRSTSSTAEANRSGPASSSSLTSAAAISRTASATAR